MEDRGTICFLFILSIFLICLIVWPRNRVERFASMDAYYLNDHTPPACSKQQYCPGICDKDNKCKRVII